ncbi:MAG: phytanoyl-CoA dioxygenase family protein [Pirellulales bacterium]|nr:phytanoyl-CoA dioxygenase family protein [Pirellulales bacterium]
MIDHERIHAAYQNDGVVRVRGFFSGAQVLAVREELKRYIRDDLAGKPYDARTYESDGRTVRNLWRLEQHNAFFNELAMGDDLTKLVAPLVGSSPILWGVETFNKPSRVGSGVPWHQDNAYFCLAPPNALTVWVALDAVTVENGPVQFIKGSHRIGAQPTRNSGVRGNSIGLATPPSFEANNLYCGVLDPGDITIHHCQTLHRSSPNRTDKSRLGLLFVYRGEQTNVDLQLRSIYEKAVAATPPA